MDELNSQAQVFDEMMSTEIQQEQIVQPDQSIPNHEQAVLGQEQNSDEKNEDKKVDLDQPESDNNNQQIESNLEEATSYCSKVVEESHLETTGSTFNEVQQNIEPELAQQTHESQLTAQTQDNSFLNEVENQAILQVSSDKEQNEANLISNLNDNNESVIQNQDNQQQQQQQTDVHIEPNPIVETHIENNDFLANQEPLLQQQTVDESHLVQTNEQDSEMKETTTTDDLNNQQSKPIMESNTLTSTINNNTNSIQENQLKDDLEAHSQSQNQTFIEETHQNELDKSIKSEVDNDLDEMNPVAAVVAAVEQAAAAKQSQPAASTASTTPRSAKKKSKSSTAAKTPSTNLNNSITSTINDIASGVTSTSPSSGQKRRKKDPYAPKAPLNGYLVYFNEERAEMRQKNPSIGFGELTKIIAAKWKELPTEDKQKYINEAELDKERYVKEMADYKKSDAYKQYLKENSQAKVARSDDLDQLNRSLSHSNVLQTQSSTNMQNQAPTSQSQQMQQLHHHQQQQQQQQQPPHPHQEQPNLSWLQNESNVAGFDIPIFTEEFIEHSKGREQELRQLRKEINEIEQQNSVLNKHIENIKQSSQKIDLDIEQYKNSNNQLQKNIDVFRQTVLHCFNNTPLPNTQDYVPTPSNIDDYIMRLFSLINLHNQNEQQAQQQQNLNDANYVMNRNFAIHVKSVFSKINFGNLFDSV